MIGCVKNELRGARLFFEGRGGVPSAAAVLVGDSSLGPKFSNFNVLTRGSE